MKQSLGRMAPSFDMQIPTIRVWKVPCRIITRMPGLTCCQRLLRVQGKVCYDPAPRRRCLWNNQNSFPCMFITLQPTVTFLLHYILITPSSFSPQPMQASKSVYYSVVLRSIDAVESAFFHSVQNLVVVQLRVNSRTSSVATIDSCITENSSSDFVCTVLPHKVHITTGVGCTWRESPLAVFIVHRTHPQPLHAYLDSAEGVTYLSSCTRTTTCICS